MLGETGKCGKEEGGGVEETAEMAHEGNVEGDGGAVL